ncbi:hypothetical protein H634G_09515 [Metarhizium anisopliae BRIP 53293]|uniref:Uncharacterized protein n=1 Tax=Metarhizium anisopliae BRIP 53293 TaxID=1291518 RepID=A0A0D9NML3_METAN|nr:hypothetical protein H634G_09515 [Metarhizium anisopliae BRIP 53293]KJK89565.1 hypothetical protein H633G_06557 [Metarhizium anisopliae BRIP 53284]
MACLAVSSPTGAKPATETPEAGNAGKEIGESAGVLGDKIAKGNGGEIADASLGLAGSILDTIFGKGKKEARDAIVTVSKPEAT